ncbi:MAG: NUDIX hydrolase [Desulfopila sp.]
MSANEHDDDLIITAEQTLLRTRVGDVVAAGATNRLTGQEARFYRFEFADWVNVIALTRERRIVLVKQFRFGSRQVELEIPGGAIDRGEAPLAAGQRELLEETGYAGPNAVVIGKVRPNPAIQRNWCYTLLVEEAEPVAEQQLDDMENIEVVTATLPEVDELISSGHISHGLVLNALMFFERYRRNHAHVSW